jgi:hypothetical protein
MEIKLLPYTAIDGIPTFTDSFIRGLYQRMAEEDLAEATFYDGTIRDAEGFLSAMKFGKNQFYVIAYKRETVGCVWLNNFQIRSAECHFCFFSNLSGRETIEVGQHIITEIVNMETVNGEPVFDVIVGITPTNNLAAIRFCRRLGFGIVGTMPHAVYDAKVGKSVEAQICYIERGYGKERR